MIQRDYILRLIADLAEFLAKLLQLSQKHLPTAYELASNKIGDLYGISYADFLKSDNSLLLKPEWPLSSGIADNMGEFLMQMAQMAGDLNKLDDRQILLMKALAMFELAENEVKTYSFNRLVTINRLKEMLGI